jgi:hypothetical protein
MKGIPAFSRYLGIDYSGAETPISSFKGLRVYAADWKSEPFEIPPPPGPRKYWTRGGIAEWLAGALSEETTTLVGIDHGFSLPLQYFQENNLPLNWTTFLDDFQRHWPTDESIYVDSVREGVCGNAAARNGKRTWRRVTEKRCRAKSVFHFDVQGSVAKSTHSGLPWLRFIDCASLAESISGPSMVGKFLLENRRWLKCIQLFGTRHSHRRSAIAINTMPTLSLHGCVALMQTPLSQASSIQIWRSRSVR